MPQRERPTLWVAMSQWSRSGDTKRHISCFTKTCRPPARSAVARISGSSREWRCTWNRCSVAGSGLRSAVWKPNDCSTPRFRAIREEFYVPLERLAAMSQDELQHHADIRQIYSQAAGLTHFLLDAQQGRYRFATMQYLLDVYRDRDRPDSLLRATQTDWANLDQQYHDFLQVHDAQLQQLDPDVRIRELCLGNTAVTDAGLATIPSLAEVTWLDLGATRFTDRGSAPLNDATRLEQLSLERTGISDTTVARLGRAAQLKQLDLSGTQITDTALKTVGKLSALESLWLSGTRVSDEGLRHLTNLQRLRLLDLSDTQCTPAGRAALQAALPELTLP